MQEAKLQRHRQCQEAAETWMKGCMSLHVGAQADTTVGALLDFKRDVIKARTGATEVSQVALGMAGRRSVKHT